MIVEGTIVVATISYLIVGPIKGLLMAASTADALLDKPEPRTIEQEDKELTFFVDDFVDQEKGELHTNFMVGKVKTSWGEEKDVVLSKAEVELMKMVSFIEAALGKGLPVGEQALKKICGLVRERTDEIARSKSRAVKVKQKEMSLAARKAQRRLSKKAA